MVFCQHIRLAALGVAVACVVSEASFAEPIDTAAFRAAVDKHCVNCHDPVDKKGGLDLEGLLEGDIADDTDAWEKALRMIDARQMPPIGKRRPADDVYESLSLYLVAALDANAAAHPAELVADTVARLAKS